MQQYKISTPAGDTLVILPRPRGGDWLEQDIRAWKREGIDLVSSLLTPKEIQELNLQEEEKFLVLNGMHYNSFPIADRSVPSSMNEFLDFLKSLKNRLDQGKTVGIHCRQGIGRSGMVAAGILMFFGASVHSAIDKVSRIRGVEIPETEEQKGWIVRLAGHVPTAESIPHRPA